MSDEAREYLRAAQAAEIRGDKLQAVELLRKAAALYRGRGNPARALQMLRQARRLDVDQGQVDEEIRRLDWTPDHPLRRAAGDEDLAETERALAPLDEAANPRPQRLIERVPVKADPSLNAWCSFCCNPTREVGDLVAGPAGAFICAGCLGSAGRILGVRVDAAGADAAGPREEAEVLEAAPEPRPAVELVGQPEAIRILDSAMRLRVRVILLLGPEGSGKTTYLRQLGAQGLGQYVDRSEALDRASDQRLLLDAIPALLADEGIRARLEATGGIIALRGEALPSTALTVASEGLELPLLGSAELVEATSGALPLGLADQVNVVAAFRTLTPDELEEITRRLLLGRQGEVEATEELIAAISATAARSGRGGHEARALVERLPAGAWSLKRAAPAAVPQAPSGPTAPARKARRKKGEEGG